MDDFASRIQSGRVTPEEMDAEYAKILGQAREKVSSSSSLSDDDRRMATEKLDTMKDVVEAGAMDALIDRLGLTSADEDANGESGGTSVPSSAVGSDLVNVVIVDEEERERRDAEETRRSAVFEESQRATRAATTSDFEPAADPTAMVPAVPEDPAEDEESDDDPPWDVDPEDEGTDTSDDEAVEVGASSGSLPGAYTPITPPKAPDVPAADTTSGPEEPVEAPPLGPQPSPTADEGRDDSNFDYLSEDIVPEKKESTLGRVFAPVLSILSTVWSRFRRLPTLLQIAAGIVVAVLVLVGFFGRGGDTKEAVENPAGVPVIINPNPGNANADQDLVELQPTGGVGSACGNKGFEASKAFGKNQGDGWVCQRGNNIDGSFMEIDFGHEVEVVSIEFIPGLWLPHASGTNEWYMHRVVSLLKVLAPPGQTQPEPIRIPDPSQTPVKKVFDKPFKATRISLIVQATKRPEDPSKKGKLQAADDVDKTFALSGLKIMGKDDSRR